MGYVLANQEGWLDELEEGKEPFDFKILNDFKNLRDGVNSECFLKNMKQTNAKKMTDGTADAFMWEIFTSKKFYDSGEIRQVGHIYTPWPSWHIVAKTELVSDSRVSAFLNGVNQGIAHFNAHPDQAVTSIAESKMMEYSREDAEEWMKTVKFADDATKVDLETIQKTIYILKKSGVIKKDISPEEMVVRV